MKISAIFLIFTVVVLATFGLMTAAIILALPTTFEKQAVGWSLAPFQSLIVLLGNLLLMPLNWLYGTLRAIALAPHTFHVMND